MAKKQKDEKSNITAEIKKALSIIFSKHPTRAFNHKQITKLFSQHYPELATKVLFIDDKDANRRAILSVLKQLTKEEEIQEVDPGRFKVIPTQMFLEGVIEITSSGSGYVINENHEEDIYISQYNTGYALNGDTVRIVLFAKNASRRQEGEVVSVTSRARNRFAGSVKLHHKYAIMTPDSNRVDLEIIVPFSKMKGAKHGDKVVVEVSKWHDDIEDAEGAVVEVLGAPGENETEMNAILVEYGFPTHFPDAIEKEAEKISMKIPATEIKKRKDLRKVTTFTIDPVDAKDFDDALSVEVIDDKNFRIGIHIADVSHYVHEGSAMDEEAYNRATSIYLVDRVVPMLPEKLSNNVCSLRPNEDKLCYSAMFTIDINAHVIDSWYGRTVIHSDKRFTYEQAQEVIENEKGELSAEILLLDRLAKKMRAQRFKNGAISFDRAEIKFNLDDDGNPVGVYAKENKDSNKLIEEFMLLANRSVAEFIGKAAAGKSKPGKVIKPPVFVYRIHDSPVPDKLKTFAGFAGRFGYTVSTSGDKNIASSLNKLLKDVKGKAEQNVLEQLAIRTMSKAVYTTENIGHYGLAFDYYTHFTSPIRRYPDVLVHRLLDHYLKGGKTVSEKDYEDMCQHSTDMEIKASEAERASIKYKQVQFLEDKKGNIFDGIISGVTEWGFYVEITENKCEGMVRLRDIPNDFYEFDEKSFAIIGHRTGKVYRLGDEVKIVVKKTDLEKKQIDFLLHNEGLSLPAHTSQKANKKFSGKKQKKKGRSGKRKR
jgi:ribonuclease R